MERIGPGDLVALSLPPQGHHDALVAVWEAGAAALPLDPALPAPARAALMARLKPTVVLDDSGYRRLSGKPVPENTALVLPTGGTSGEPKAVMLGHGALDAARRAAAARLGLEGKESWLCCLPVWHVAGLMTIVRALLSGTRARLAYPFEPGALDRSRGLVSLVPTMLKRALDAGVRLDRFEAVLLGGGSIPGALVERARAARVSLVTTYGMTETCGGVVYDGRPLGGVEVAVRAGGRLALKGPMLLSGYRAGPPQPFDADGFFVTSDLGEVTDDGRVVVLGRADTAIVSGGHKVFPERVAALLLGDRRVAEAVVIGVPDEEWGQVVTAVVVPAPGHAPSLADLRAVVKAELPAWAAPRRLELVDALPRLPSGKVDRAALLTGIVGASDQG